MVHISYKGAGPAVADLVANQIPAAVMTLSSANAHVAAGKLRLLAASASKRLADFPHVPTLAEVGYPGLTGITWFALSGPEGMASAVVERINAEVRRATYRRRQGGAAGRAHGDDGPRPGRLHARHAVRIDRRTPAVKSVEKSGKQPRHPLH